MCIDVTSFAGEEEAGGGFAACDRLSPARGEGGGAVLGVQILCASLAVSLCVQSSRLTT